LPHHAKRLYVVHMNETFAYIAVMFIKLEVADFTPHTVLP